MVESLVCMNGTLHAANWFMDYVLRSDQGHLTAQLRGPASTSQIRDMLKQMAARRDASHGGLVDVSLKACPTMMRVFLDRADALHWLGES